MDDNKEQENRPVKEEGRHSEDPEKLALGPDGDDGFTGMPDAGMPDLEPEQSGRGQMKQAKKSTGEQ